MSPWGHSSGVRWSQRNIGSVHCRLCRKLGRLCARTLRERAGLEAEMGNLWTRLHSPGQWTNQHTTFDWSSVWGEQLSARYKILFLNTKKKEKSQSFSKLTVSHFESPKNQIDNKIWLSEYIDTYKSILVSTLPVKVSTFNPFQDRSRKLLFILSAQILIIMNLLNRNICLLQYGTECLVIVFHLGDLRCEEELQTTDFTLLKIRK